MEHFKRSDKLELIDLGPSYYADEEYEDWLYQMSRSGQLTGGDKATFRAINSLRKPPRSILDVGCGGGNFTLLLAQKYPQVKILGVDTSEKAICYANNLLASKGGAFPNVSFQHLKQPNLDSTFKDFDLILATLLCHHMGDKELASFIEQMVKLAKQAVILNDLHRHWAATALFYGLAPLFFRNRIYLHDGAISIRRAFTNSDWNRIMQMAGLKRSAWRLTWNWPFRWTITINTEAL